MTVAVPPPDVPAVPLTELERRFVEELLSGPSATQAYLRCRPGVRRRTAAARAATLLARPHVAAELRAARLAQSRRCHVRADGVLQELAAIALSDIGALFDDRGRVIVRANNLPWEVRRAVRSVIVSRVRTTTTTNGRTRRTVREDIIEVRLHDKMAALQKLANYLGLNTSIPPVEALLALLPADLSAAVAAAMVPPRGTKPPAGYQEHRPWGPTQKAPQPTDAPRQWGTVPGGGRRYIYPPKDE